MDDREWEEKCKEWAENRRLLRETMLAQLEQLRQIRAKLDMANGRLREVGEALVDE